MSTSSAIDSSSSPVTADVMASVINVASVKTHVPITLDITGSNYSQWSTLFTVFVGKYGLLGFIDGTIEPIINEPHRRQDFAVRSWLYGSISEEIFEIIVEPNQTARETWTAIEELFRDNKESRVVFLEAEFRSIVQGDMTIADYCCKIKKTADALRDVGQPVSDKALVLNTLRGLSKRFSSTAQLIPLLDPFPSFLRTRSILAMAETKAAHEVAVVTGTALFSSTAGTSSDSQSGGGRRSDWRGKSSGGGKKWNKSSNKSRDNRHTNTGGFNARPGAPGGGSWFCFNPWHYYITALMQRS